MQVVQYAKKHRVPVWKSCRTYTICRTRYEGCAETLARNRVFLQTYARATERVSIPYKSHRAVGYRYERLTEVTEKTAEYGYEILQNSQNYRVWVIPG